MKSSIKKNLLDLEHSVSLAKAGTFLALSFTSWIALFFGMKEFYKDNNIIIITSTLVLLFFLFSAMKYSRNCEEIQIKIKEIQ